MTLTVNRKSITQELNIAPNSFSVWSKRKTFPAADVAVAIARQLKTTVEYLVTGEKRAAYGLPSRIAAIVEDLEKLKDSDIEAVGILARGLVARSARAFDYPPTDSSNATFREGRRGPDLMDDSKEGTGA